MVTPSLTLQQLFVLVSDFAIIIFITGLVLASFFSIFFILHFHIKTKRSHRLKDFNSLWTVRILLVTFITFWAVSEFLRLPLAHRHLYSGKHQIDICKYHVVLSQGLFQPGFLVTLLYLVNFSIKKQTPEDTFGTVIAIVFALCFPILLLQIFFVFHVNESFFPNTLWRSSVAVGHGRVLCAYPLFSTIVFATFSAVYLMVFLLSCWKVVSLVINKGLRVRIYTLGFAIVLALPVQLTCIGVSSLWDPNDMEFHGLSFIAFLSMLLCAVVGEGILVIRPIADALAVGNESFCMDRLPVASTEKTVVLGQEQCQAGK